MSTETTTDPHQVPEDFAKLITEPSAFGEPAEIHAALSQLRATQPIGRVCSARFDPFWLITRHADILEIERHADVFHNGDRSTVLVDKAMIDAIEAKFHSPHLTRSVVNMDRDEHRTYRMLTQAWFVPGNIKKLSDRIRAIARHSVDRMLAKGGSCDFVEDVALHYPLRVIMEILGVPEADEAKMLALTQQLFGARDPEKSRNAGAMADASSALDVFNSVLGDFYTYFDRLTEKRRAEPCDDVASVIANARIDGEPIAAREANSYYVLVATAGHDTTSASIAGAIWALAERPDQWAKVKADPSLIPGLVEEAIRWTTPVKHFMRTATQDYQLHDTTIRAGDWLMLSYLSANRDEAVFERPFEFEVDRQPNKQLAFGYGPHVCLGQHLARLEMRILFEELLPRLKAIELAGHPRWTQSSFVSGPKTVPLRYSPA